MVISMVTTVRTSHLTRHYKVPFVLSHMSHLVTILVVNIFKWLQFYSSVKQTVTRPCNGTEEDFDNSYV